MDGRDIAIRDLLRRCGAQARQMAQTGFEVMEKGPSDYVTTVDQALDREFTQHFRQWFPADGLITEENPDSRQAYAQFPQRLWCIDPIDGTDDFVHHRPYYSLMVGLLEQYQPRAGWVYAPVLERMYWGGVGQGLYQQLPDDSITELPCKIPEPPSNWYCPLMIGDKDRHRYGTALERLIPGVDFQSMGSFGLKVVEVIRGRALVYMYFNQRVKIWDTVGPIALAQAAGLTCCDLAGHPLRFDPGAVDATSLGHQQRILVGWPDALAKLLPLIQQAVQMTEAL
ncbi:Archaeal fructose-1,6-bisphosphatase and related enzymes of inositol monophosphatase family [Gloeomargarita lithophora Alchichica-D10]|uniref:Archaeal fructose-1,6-bisphosphatase and related enzymes of inositol monophosphatase family n=1 Tax=Gloeomargarita lithophora Alchichica-D10 TaxID=1188229 RepID=A0A1J0ADN2_9CYAN|nr:inositol monophosphatase family protein [Gloeomargarita lithophora]APB34054.1 Archaeal fructose-1,6-bisphosphatase and related enzymes of inositol monophosphatase family [Gloeomargarita lithophora Alchichica-D10]